MPPQELRPFRGTDRFEILRPLGAGGMGVVYEARDRERDARVALKTLQRLDHATLSRFKQEFRALRELTHRNLVQLHELFSENETWFFVMELVDGLPFLDWVRGERDAASGMTVTTPRVETPSDRTVAMEAMDRDAPRVVRPLGGDDAVARLRAATAQLVEGIGALHRARKLHRDIKPSNVMVTREGRVVILDFGLITELEGQPVDPHSRFRRAGTLGYMSPEQLRGDELTAASDWYALGVTVFEALTGGWPFEGTTQDIIRAKLAEDAPRPDELDGDLPSDLSELCARLVRCDPATRADEAELRIALGLDDAAGAGAEGVVLPEAPFVGRESQLAELDGALRSVEAGTTTAVTVHGASGSGKSALVERFLASVPRSRALVLRGRCYEEESVPYKAVDGLVDALGRHLRAYPPPVVPADVEALARLFPVLAHLAGKEGSPAGDVSDPLDLRRRAFAALRGLLAHLGEREPLILVIDDLQWGDDDSAALLSDLLRPPEPPRVLLVGTYRSEYAATSPCVSALHDVLRSDAEPLRIVDLAVEPLTEGEARELVRTVLGADDDAVLAEITAEAAGHPYFLQELARARRAGDAVGERGSLTLDDVLWRRVQALPGQSRRLLEAVAISGRPLRQVDAYDAVRVSPGNRAALHRLRLDGLVRTDGPGIHDEVETYHDRIRETILARIDGGLRRTYHHDLAVTLERSESADAEALAFHFDGGGVADRAGHYYAEAGETASDALAFDRAARMYRRSLELRPVTGREGRRLRSRLADALANAGRGHDAGTEYDTAAVTADGAEALELQAKAAYQYCISGHLDDGKQRFGEVLRRLGTPLPGSPTAALFSYLGSRTRLFFRGFRFRERPAARVPPEELRRFDIARSVAVGLSVADPIGGADFQTRSLLLALKTGEPYRVALAMAWEASHSSLGGRSTEKRTDRLLREARALAARVDEPHAHGLVSLASGVRNFMSGRFPAGGAYSDMARAIFREECTGVAWELDTSSIFGFWCRLLSGDVDELRRRYADQLHEARQRENLFAAVNLVAQGGTLVHLADDRVNESFEEMERIMSRWTPPSFTIQHLGQRYGQMYRALYTGEGEQAWSIAERTWPECRRAMHLRVQYIRIHLRTLTAAAAVATAADAPDPASRLAAAEAHARKLRRERLPWSDLQADVVEAGVLGRRGRTDGAASRLASAVRAADEQGFVMLGAAVRNRLGRLLGGDEGAARRSEAAATFAEHGIVNPDRMTALYAPGFD